MNYLDHFIIIDDDKLNNTLCRKVLEKTYPDSRITDFSDPVKGFAYLAEAFSKPEEEQKTILLLDISMPVMNAWQFLEKFEALDALTKSRIKIYVLSSSIDKNDMVRAQSDKNVEYYLIKPLTKESIRLIVHVLNKRQGLD
jgi:CheY-like chemotaxis protein